MKRSSPDGYVESASKRRSIQPPSPASTKASPALPRHTDAMYAKYARKTKLLEMERVLDAKFQSEYKHDIVTYMNETEKMTQASPDMMDLQPELEWYMRPFLLDFLIEVHAGFRLQATTLHLAINLIDRYTSKRVVFKKHYQLLGCSALWIAAKYEEAKDKVPNVKELKAMCCDSYREEMFQQMEGHILKTLEWNIGHPTTDAFLTVLLTEPAADDTAKTAHLARMLTEIALFHRSFVLFQPSTVAQAALLFARHMLRQSPGDASKNSAHNIACMHALKAHLDEASPVLLKKYSQSSYVNVTAVLRHYTHPPSAFASPPSPPISSKGRSSSSKPNITPVRQAHTYAHGMITPPAEDERINGPYSDDYVFDACSETSMSPMSPTSSILDSYSDHDYVQGVATH